MNGFALVFNFINVPKVNLSTPAALPLLIVRICWVTTDNTTEMRLNSSKQHQLPQPARPLKNLARPCSLIDQNS